MRNIHLLSFHVLYSTVRPNTVLVNRSFSSSSVETACKQCTSLSPISELPVLSKNEKHNLVNAHPSGICSGYSTQDVLLHVRN